MKTLLLTEKDVKKLLTMDEVMQAVESAFKAKGLGHAQMPAKVYLFYNKYKGDLRAMPSYLEELDVSAVKIVNSHSENRTKYGLPTVMAIIILVDPKNGAPIAMMVGAIYASMMGWGRHPVLECIAFGATVFALSAYAVSMFLCGAAYVLNKAMRWFDNVDDDCWAAAWCFAATMMSPAIVGLGLWIAMRISTGPRP